MLNKYHQLAIEIKYEGKTYEEISTALRGVISVQTIKSWFMKDGTLYIEYLKYETEQKETRARAAQKEFEKDAAIAAQQIHNVLARAIKSKDDKMIMEVSREILDRAGMPVVRKSEVKVEKPETEYDQYLAECKRLGVDPATGFPPHTPKVLTN